MATFLSALFLLAFSSYQCHAAPANGTVSMLSLNGPPDYDHQNTTYHSHFKPLSITSQPGLTIMPFFSPDSSISIETEFIEQAQVSVDIGIPSFSSWSTCTYTSGGCMGCTPTAQRAEEFPLFQALLNALHRNVSVRIMTNNYGDEDCSGKISPLPFLILNGAQVRYYKTTTYIHAKYIAADGERTAISSVNFSETSFMDNREAGGVFAGENSAEVVGFTQGVFDYDWNQGYPHVMSQTYSQSALAIIQNPEAVPVVVPPIPNIPGAYHPPTPTPIALPAGTPVTIYASPDYAYDALMEDISERAVKSSFEIMIYQINEDGLCQQILDLHEQGRDVTVLVSSRIYGSGDCATANECYTYLAEAGMTIYKTPDYYTFSHQKFWIVDRERVAWSTGNWSPTDYPDASTFPPYDVSPSTWIKANRDFTVSIQDPTIVELYGTLFDEDKSRGSTWSKSSPVTCGATAEL